MKNDWNEVMLENFQNYWGMFKTIQQIELFILIVESAWRIFAYYWLI